MVDRQQDNRGDRSSSGAWRRRCSVGLIGLVTTALVLGTGALPAIAGPVAQDRTSRPIAAMPAQGVRHGGASDTDKALASAKSTHKRVEVTSKRGASTTTFANPDGTLTDVLTAAPTRAKDASGDFVALNQSLAKDGGRLAPKASGANVTFRAAAPAIKAPAIKSAAGAGGSDVTPDVASLDLPGAADISVGFGGALPAPTVSGDTATYAISSSAALTTTALEDGFAADVVLQSAPAEAPTYSFPLQLAGGLTPKLTAGVLQFVKGDGTVAASSRPLEMWDAHRDSAGDPSHVAAVDSKLVKTGAGWTLEMTPSQAYLSNASTQYPVTIDPTIVTTSGGDTWYYNGNSTDEGADYRLMVGEMDGNTHANRSYLTWNTGPWTGRVVTNATMNLYQYEAGSCDPKVTKVFPTTTYSALDAADVKINTDSAWYQSPSFNTGGDGCSTSNGYVPLDVTKIVSGWTTGEVPEYGMEMRASVETDTAYGKRFCSRNAAPAGTGHCEGTSGMPSLSITYVYDLGVQPHGSLISHRLNDRSQISVNPSDGDGVYESSDVHLSGRGLDLSIDRFWDSQTSRDSQFGTGWAMSAGADVYLSRGATSDRWDYISPSGTWYGRLVRKTTSGDTNSFWMPTFGGLNADMKDNGDNTFTMTFHSSQEKYTFDTLGCATCNMVLTKDTDRNGNAISYKYDSASRQLTSIVDTHGRTLTVHHNAVGYIDSITESGSYAPTPRLWSYHYNGSNQLDYYTDPTGARTDYGYANGQLTTITDPARTDGVRPTTTLTYSNGQTTGVAYTSDAGGRVKQFTYSYSTDTAAAQNACNTDDSWDRFTTVTDVSDPQGGATKYCFRDRLKPPSPTSPNANSDDAEKTRVVDGNGYHRSSSYTPDLASQNGTSQSNDGVTGGSTVYTYNTNNTLQKVTAPKDASGSSTAGTASFDYATSSSVAGGSFLPSSTATGGSSCSSMTYDAKGNLTDSYAGQAATSGKSTCSGGTGGRHSHVDYNSDGTPSSAYGPAAAALGTVTASDKTVYTYYDTEPNKGELKQVVKPGGNSTCTTDRTGCTTYTYDGYSRVATTTDGNGNTTTYSYDKDDRITQVLTAGATSCTPTAGTCVKYSYDAEGNLVTRVDKTGTTTFTFDYLNNPATQTQPDSTKLTTVFDGAGNLTSYTQALPSQTADTVGYTYDAANQLTKVTDATGSYTYTYNNDGRPTKLTLPSSTGVSIAYGYTGSGKTKSITPSATTLPSYAYDYSSSGTDTQTLRKTTNRDSSTISYAYDSADRLKTADASTGTDYSYTYDADSNLRSAAAGSSTTYYGYNENDQLCWSGSTDSSSAAMARTCAATPSGNATYTSDKAGENLGTSTGPIHYNAQLQVDQISSTSGAGPVAQTYADQGNNLRTKAGSDSFTAGTKLGVTARTTGGQATFYTRDATGQIIGEHGASGTFYYLTDRLGSVTALIDTAGGKAGSYTYDPFGKTTVAAGTSTTAAQASPWRYTGAYQDPTDGYYKLGARYYDAAGHFTQSDSIAGNIGRAEQYNSYTYTAGDPINRTDLSGKSVGGAAADAAVSSIAVAATALFCISSGGLGCLALGIAFGAIFGALGGVTGALVDGKSGGASLSEAALEGAISGAVGAVVGGALGKAVKLIRGL